MYVSQIIQHPRLMRSSPGTPHLPAYRLSLEAEECSFHCQTHALSRPGCALHPSTGMLKICVAYVSSLKAFGHSGLRALAG